MGSMHFIVTIAAVDCETVQFTVRGQRIVRTAITIQLQPDVLGYFAEHIEPALAAESLEKVAHAQAVADQELKFLHPSPSGGGIIDDSTNASLQKFAIGKLGAVARALRSGESRFKRSIE